MKKFSLILLIAIFAVLSLSIKAQKIPLIESLKEVSQLPAEIPQRVSALAFDGEKLWFAVYLDKGRYATFNPQTYEWKYSDAETQHQAIRRVSQPFYSAAGMFFVGKKLWVSGSYGESFGLIDTESWQVEKVFTQMARPELKKTNSQIYAGISFDGENLWMAWHLVDYKLPDSEVRQLLKINPETGKILEKYPLPALSRYDGAQGLTFDGANLWYIKDKHLFAFDLNGKLLARYKLERLYRPSGLAWDGKSLWIVQFDGKLWNLPFEN
jgi:outer membrane protein assembly factor BamB